MSTLDQLLGEFIDDWNAGKRPNVEDFLRRAPEDARDELAARLGTWLEIAPTPAFDADATRAIAEEPLLRAALAAAASARRPVNERVHDLREQADLTVGDVAGQLVAVFELKGAEGRTIDYLQRLEEGELDESRLSKRLLDALARIFGVARNTLMVSSPGTTPFDSAAYALFRAEDDADEWISADIDALSRAATADAPSPMGEVDRLFVGGPAG